MQTRQRNKAEAVDVIRANAKGVGAKDLGPTTTAVRPRVRRAQIDGSRGPSGALSTAEHRELMQLRQRVKTLERERDMLKAATAFFATQSAWGSDLWRRRRPADR
jgi:transposase-like protein